MAVVFQRLTERAAIRILDSIHHRVRHLTEFLRCEDLHDPTEQRGVHPCIHGLTRGQIHHHAGGLPIAR